MSRSLSLMMTRTAALAFAAASMLPGAARAQEDPPYVVKEGMVDKGTYNGYRRYDNSCMRCHGQSAIGSSFAPSLVDSLKRLSYDSSWRSSSTAARTSAPARRR